MCVDKLYQMFAPPRVALRVRLRVEVARQAELIQLLLSRSLDPATGSEVRRAAAAAAPEQDQPPRQPPQPAQEEHAEASLLSAQSNGSSLSLKLRI